MTHAVENKSEDEDFRLTRLIWGWTIVVSDATSVVLHGPSQWHAVLLVAATGLLYPHRLTQVMALALETFRSRRSP